MRLLHLLALMGTCLLSGTAAQDPEFPLDEPGFRLDCDDWASTLPTAREYWDRATPVDMTLAEASEIVVNHFAKEGWEARVISGVLVMLGKPYYSFELVTRRVKPDDEIDYMRWEARVGVKMRGVKFRWPRYQFPGTATSNEIITLDSGLRYSDIRTGDGQEVKPDSKIRYHYVLNCLDGIPLRNTYEERNVQALEVKDLPLAGLREGVIGMRVGGKRKLIIPPGLAFGDKAATDGGEIPPNATVVYDVEIMNVR